jgi:hypothetical protein
MVVSYILDARVLSSVFSLVNPGQNAKLGWTSASLIHIFLLTSPPALENVDFGSHHRGAYSGNCSKWTLAAD